MTVIAFDKTHIAWDGRVSWGSSVYADDARKVKVVDGAVYGFCGDLGLMDSAIKWHRGGARVDRVPPSLVKKKKDDDDVDDDPEWTLVVITRKEISLYSGDILFKTVVKAPYAIGSGSDFARGALLSRASAYRACVIACKLDTGCGGTVTTLAFADVFRGGLFDVNKRKTRADGHSQGKTPTAGSLG